MNNIKELAEKAGWVDWTDDDNWIYPPAKESGYFVLADLEKFAEVVINELSSMLINQSENQEPVQSSVGPLFDAGMATGLKQGYQHSAELIQNYL
jgi:hypothetical protein